VYEKNGVLGKMVLPGVAAIGQMEDGAELFIQGEAIDLKNK